MAEWVSDASPIIALSWIGAAALLGQVLGTVLVPEAVVRETGGLPPGARTVTPEPDGAFRALGLQLDAGEAAAVAVALERHAGLIVDERRARRVATTLGVPVVGTLGVVALGWRRGLVADPLQTVQALQERGFWLSEDVLAAFRALLR